MAIIQGLRGTGSWGADERPKDYRETILFLFPNGDAPLTALTSKVKKQSTKDPEFKWFEKGLPVRRATVNGAQTNSETTIEINSNLAKIFRSGDVILNERTLEQMWVTADPTLTTEITVARAKGGTTGTAMNDLDGLVVIGRAFAEGVGVPTAVSFDPSVPFNYTQIFRTPINITGTAEATELRWGKPVPELRREALQTHAIDMELGFLFGKREEDVSGAQPKRTTGGLMHFLSTNVLDAATDVSEAEWDDYMRQIFAFGSTEKLALLGNVAAGTLMRLAKKSGTIVLGPRDQAYGMKLVEYITNHGTLFLKTHPLLTNNATFASWLFAIDLDKIVYRFMNGRDTNLLKDRQNPGDDVKTEEWFTECGLEVQHEKAHAVIKNLINFVP